MSEPAINAIKVIDVGRVSVEVEEVSPGDLEEVGALISQAFQQTGFAYIQNHGIPPAVIDSAFRSSMEFFTMDDSTKEQVSKGVEYQGWVCEGREIFDQDEQGNIADHEVRETYDMKNISGTGIFPDSACPSLRPALSQLAEVSRKLTHRLLGSISTCLDQEKDYLSKLHKGMFSEGFEEIIGNATTLRSIHYPPLSEEDIKPGIIRCGEHSDYGTITILFQDDMGGLEVKSVKDSWIPADPIPGAILINVGDLLENLTGGRYPATKHRVRIPQEEVRRRCKRQSIAFFVHPDDAVLCSPLSGPDPAYPPVTAKQHLENRFSETYGTRLELQSEAEK